MATLTLCGGQALPQPNCEALPTSAPVLQTRAVPGPLIDAQCNASMIPGLAAAVRSGTPVPGGGELRFVDSWQAQCELFRNGKGTGQLKSATVCPVASTRVQESGVWKCRGPDRLVEVQVGTSNPRQACEQARARPESGFRAKADPGPPAPVADPKPLPAPAVPGPTARVGPPSVVLPEKPLPDLVVAAVREVPASSQVDVVVRNVGGAPNLKQCWLRSYSWSYDVGSTSPTRWEMTGCRGQPALAIPTLAPGQEATLRACGYSREEIERDTGLWTRIQIDRDCDPQRDGNNLFEHRRELSAEALRRETCARQKDLPECRK